MLQLHFVHYQKLFALIVHHYQEYHHIFLVYYHSIYYNHTLKLNHKNHLYLYCIIDLSFLFLNILQYDPQVLTLPAHILITYIVLSQDSQKSYKPIYYYIFLLIPILLIAFNAGSLEQINGEKMKEIVINTYGFILIDHPESFSMIDTNDLGGNDSKVVKLVES